MNPDFAIVLNFKINGNADADFLVKTARNIGARAVMTNAQKDDFEKACSKYTIFLADEADGIDLNGDDVIDTIVNNRQNGKNTIINIPVTDGKFDDATQKVVPDMKLDNAAVKMAQQKYREMFDFIKPEEIKAL